MQTEALNLDDAVALLERTPASLSQLLAGLPERWVRATESHGSWSPYDVVAHLINGERTNWMLRARHILSGQRQPFEPFDRSPDSVDLQGKTIDELLTLFADLRHENLGALRELDVTAADLSRTGLHPEFGEVALGQLLATWVVHDLNHLGQIVQTMAKLYRDAVGPWRAYLSILEDSE